MRFNVFKPTILCSLLLIVGCAKTEDEPQAANTAPATQPAAVNPAPAVTVVEPTASMMMISDRGPQVFPSACLRLTSIDGKVSCRLYSDDPRSILTGNDSVNSYDMILPIPNISSPADLSGKSWTMSPGSMDKQDDKYGIFLNGEQDILQPMYVTYAFQQQGQRMLVSMWGTFNLFHITDQNPNPAPKPVTIRAQLDAKLVAEQK
jgi:hypothetical protein